MIESKDLHERHFFESKECPERYYNFSDVPAMYVVKSGKGFIPYYWNPKDNQWDAGIMFTELNELDNFINTHRKRTFSWISNLMRKHT